MPIEGEMVSRNSIKLLFSALLGAQVFGAAGGRAMAAPLVALAGGTRA